jgi:hypothetical protein
MAALYSTLPRELRDCIYEYVLTDPVGLSYRTGDDGFSRICASSSFDLVQDAPANTKKRRLWSSVYSAFCAMFSLGSSQQQVESFNQIQYVSRAFRRETFGLEFRYNGVVFEDSERLGAAQRCRVFVNKVHGRDYADNLTLYIMGSHLSLKREAATQALTLLEFCAHHPKATIRLHDHLWSLKDPNFILLGLAYTTALRGDRDGLTRLMRNSDPTLSFDLSDVCTTLPKKIPRNYRFLPAEKHLSRATLMASYHRSPILDGTDASQWIDLAEHWFKEGV